MFKILIVSVLAFGFSLGASAKVVCGDKTYKTKAFASSPVDSGQDCSTLVNDSVAIETRDAALLKLDKEIKKLHLKHDDECAQAGGEIVRVAMKPVDELIEAVQNYKMNACRNIVWAKAEFKCVCKP